MSRPWSVRPLGSMATASLLIAALLAACTQGPILANPSAVPATPRPTPVPSSGEPDPVAIGLPRDDAPHDRLTEWWYYTGHLDAADGRSFGFEFVVFRAERGAFPTTWASHLALTDEAGQAFRYTQRSEIGPQVDRSAPTSDRGFDLAIAGVDVSQSPATQAREPWTMTGANGADRLHAFAPAAESSTPFGLDLMLETTKPAVLHDGDGWIDFGPAGGSYYYSRTRMTAAGSLMLDGETLQVEGIGWFDHQWGDFISVGGSGWDWFAVNLADGTDLALSLVRDASGAYPLVYGTLVEGDGTVLHLDRDAFTVESTASWSSSHTGATYPAAWTIDVPAHDLTIGLRPTVADQELDTRATTGVVYWEGSQLVDAVRAGRPVEGEAYVELTGYATDAP